MKGLELCEKYFRAHGAPLIATGFPDYEGRIAAGLVGGCSDTYGFDDEISQDHNWGPRFCLWLSAEDYGQIGEQLQAELRELPKEFMGFAAPCDGNLTEAYEIGQFYQDIIGVDHPPLTLDVWLGRRHDKLYNATTGAVFCDPLGKFTEFRDRLLEHYPDEMRRNMIAGCCLRAGQTGQPNLDRCIRRSDYVAGHIGVTFFIIEITNLAFHLNRRYMPFYKWMHRALRELPILGEYLHQELAEFVSQVGVDDMEALLKNRQQRIERIAEAVVQELRRQGLTDLDTTYLLQQSRRISELSGRSS